MYVSSLDTQYWKWNYMINYQECTRVSITDEFLQSSFVTYSELIITGSSDRIIFKLTCVHLVQYICIYKPTVYYIYINQLTAILVD